MRDSFNEINITPLTDIFLVLLIIMMVIAPLLDQQGLNLTVPENVKAETVLEGDIVFNDKEFDEFGWSIGQRVKAGALRCGSVGFLAEEVEFLEAKDRECDLIFRKQELLEFSICCVPANPFARSGTKKLEITEVIQESEELSYWDKLRAGLGKVDS